MKATWVLDRGQIRDSDGNVLASVPYALGDAQDRKNGQLMVAASDMLVALQSIAEWLIKPDLSPIMQTHYLGLCLAAIAKATKGNESNLSEQKEIDEAYRNWPGPLGDTHEEDYDEPSIAFCPPA